MATYNTNGTMTDVQAKIDAASPGDTIVVPAGTHTWGGAGGWAINLNKNVILTGISQADTIINQGADTSWASVAVSAGTLRSMTINGGAKTIIKLQGGDWWRLTDLYLNGGSSYIIEASAAFGLIDHCTMVWTGEQVFMRGKSGSWNLDDSLGTVDAIYIEDCTFNGGSGYTDGHGDSRVVYRRNTFNCTAKLDAHGIWSNSPFDSCRTWEAYYNTWTTNGVGGAWQIMEWRGGTGMAFFNTGLDNSNTIRGSLKLQEYGATSGGGYFGRYMGPDDYPIHRQLGRGKANASSPCYFWGNTRVAPYGQAGAVSMTFVTGIIPQGSIDAYRTRIGDANATFTHDDIVKRDRDYFTDIVGSGFGSFLSFNGTSGTGIGTKAQMLAITPTLTGVGYWVTDEGDWDTTKSAGTSGRLYTWTGAAWVLKYEPYTYPHPLTNGPLPEVAPTFKTHPQGGNANAGTTVVLSFTYAGQPTPTFQWRKGGVNINGQTGSSLVLANVTAANNGSYDCVAVNSLGTTTSNAAVLTVLEIAPGFSQHPVAGVTVVTTTKVLSVVVTGAPTPTYQWRKDGVNINGATSATYTLASVAYEDAGTYDCVCTNYVGTTTSNPTVLSVRGAIIPPPANPKRAFSRRVISSSSGLGPAIL